MNTEKTPYQQLLEKLDDRMFAQKFFDEKETEAKFLIYDILAVTMGWSVVTEDGNEWACRSLCKVLDMFMIRHENFERGQLAENLQMHIFNYTMKYSEAYDKWKKDWEIENSFSDSPEEQNTDIKNDPLAEHTFSILANKIGHALSSNQVSDDTKNAVIGVMYAASNESGVGFDDSPEIAKASFPVIMQALDISAQRAYLHSVDHILGCCVPESVSNELKQYEVRFDTNLQKMQQAEGAGA